MSIFLAPRPPSASDSNMKIPTILIGAAALAWTAVAEEQTKENTYFNGKKVPPLIEFTPDNFETEVKATKYTFIKHYRYGEALCRVWRS